MKQCIGYGPWRGCCTNDAGTPWTPHWCPRCDELRRAMILLQLAAIQNEAPALPDPTTEDEANAIIERRKVQP